MAMAITATAAAQQDTLLHETFDGGIPAGFTVLDRDEDPVLTTLYKGAAFSQGWEANVIDSKDNKAAFSFSRTTYSMPQENWLITPAVELPVGSDAVLRWAARSVHNDFREDYKVMVSATGAELSAFTELCSFSGESYLWKDHAVSLKDYAGKTVNIAFVATSTAKFILAIDDVFIGSPKGYSFEARNTSSRFAGMEAATTIGGTLRNTGRTAEVTGIDLSTPDGVVSVDRAVTLAPEDTVNYEFVLPLKNHSVNRYAVTLRFADGTESTVVNDSVITSYFPRTLVLDEATGNWCNNCPYMFPFLAKVKERMGSDAIVISAHISQASPDPLSCPVYSTNQGICRWLQSLPSYVVNRKRDYLCTDPYHPDGYLERAALDPTYAMVEATAEQDGDKINIKAQVEFGVDYDNADGRYNVGFALIDDEYAQGDVYQNNNVTTPSGEEYMYLPVAVPGEMMRYHDVPIEATTAFSGVEGALPAEIKAGETYCVDYQMAIPEGRTFGDDDLSVVAFVFQSRTGELLNATRVPLKLSAVALGVGSVATAGGVAVSKQADGSVAVSLPAGTGGVVGIYSLDGRLVRSATVNGGSATVDCRGLSGCYVVKVAAGGAEAVRKVVF